MKRKILALILAILSLSFSFVACNENEDSSDDPIGWHTPYKYTLPDFETDYTEQEHIERISAYAQLVSDSARYELTNHEVEILYSFDDKPSYFLVTYSGIAYDEENECYVEDELWWNVGVIIEDQYFYLQAWWDAKASDLFGGFNNPKERKNPFEAHGVEGKKYVGWYYNDFFFASKNEDGDFVILKETDTEVVSKDKSSSYILKDIYAISYFSHYSEYFGKFMPEESKLRARYYLPEYESEKSEQEHVDYLMANAESKVGQSFMLNNRNCTYDRLEFDIVSGFNSEQKYFVAKQYASYYEKNELVNEVYEWTLGVIINDNYYVIKEYMPENDDFIEYPFIEGANKFLGMDFVRSTGTHATGSGAWQMFFGSELDGEYTIVRQNGRELSNIPDLSEFEIEFLFQDGKATASLDNFIKYI